MSKTAKIEVRTTEDLKSQLILKVGKGKVSKHVEALIIKDLKTKN